jgi:hypothetical protein
MAKDTMIETFGVMMVEEVKGGRQRAQGLEAQQTQLQAKEGEIVLSPAWLTATGVWVDNRRAPAETEQAQEHRQAHQQDSQSRNDPKYDQFRHTDHAYILRGRSTGGHPGSCLLEACSLPQV